MSHSDLTIADYWGVNHLMPDFDDDKGVGLVLVNTEKGKSAFERLDMEVRPSTLEDARRFNGGFKEEMKVHPKRERFFRDLSEGKSVTEAVERALHVPLYRRVWRKVKKRIGTFFTK